MSRVLDKVSSGLAKTKVLASNITTLLTEPGQKPFVGTVSN